MPVGIRLDHLWYIQGTVASLIAAGAATEQLQKLAEDTCRHQLARIETALKAAADTAGNTDIAAPATQESIDEFLAHVDDDWNRAPNALFDYAQRLEAGAGMKSFILRKALIDLCLGVKLGTLSCMRLHRLRISDVSQTILDLDALARKCAGKNRGLFGLGRKIDVRSNGAAAIAGNPGMTEMAVDELIQNALAFSKVQIRISLTREGSNLALFVDDDGDGFAIPPKEALLPFERIRKAVFEDFSNCRLGLGNIDLTVRRSGWSLDFVAGERGLKSIYGPPKYRPLTVPLSSTRPGLESAPSARKT